LKEWIKALRLPAVLLAGLLTLASFKISGLLLSEAILPALTVILVASAYMVQNDWRDRFHDVKKGKTLAFSQSNKFLLFVVIIWTLALVSIVLTWRQDDRFGVFLVSIFLLGLVHPETRRIALVPITLTAVISASSALFPVFIGRNSSDL
jgi:4-hydroxybenzoate polyprenyltransferase